MHEMGRKRAGFADLQTTRLAFSQDGVRCPSCNRRVGQADNPKLIPTFGTAEPTLATLTCQRCRTTLTIRFVDEE